jgi:hypothetical protein
MAAFVAAGVGAFALGLLVVLNEAELFAAPAFYGPAGGVTGRTGMAAAIWLIAWAVLHRRWRNRAIDDRRVNTLALILIALGVLLTFPPVWSLL